MEQLDLFNATDVETKKRVILICSKPKTYISVPIDATEGYIAERKARFFDEENNFKTDVPWEKFLT